MELFTKFNYQKYKANKQSYLNLSSQALEKLKIISLIEFCENKRDLHFEDLNKEFDIENEFDLHNLIFKAISLNLISGKIDEKNRTLKVKH